MSNKCNIYLAKSVSITQIDSPSCKEFLLVVEKLQPVTQVKCSTGATVVQICPSCEGTGNLYPIKLEKPIVCSRCKGTGKLLLT